MEFSTENPCLHLHVRVWKQNVARKTPWRFEFLLLSKSTAIDMLCLCSCRFQQVKNLLSDQYLTLTSSLQLFCANLKTKKRSRMCSKIALGNWLCSSLRLPCFFGKFQNYKIPTHVNRNDSNSSGTFAMCSALLPFCLLPSLYHRNSAAKSVCESHHFRTQNKTEGRSFHGDFPSSGWNMRYLSRTSLCPTSSSKAQAASFMSQRGVSKSPGLKTLCVLLFGCGPKVNYLQPMLPAFYETPPLKVISLFEKGLQHTRWFWE